MTIEETFLYPLALCKPSSSSSVSMQHLSGEAMKSLIELYKESNDTKSEINILISESNNPGNALERRLSLLAEITALHQKLNGILHEIKQRRLKQLHYE